MAASIDVDSAVLVLSDDEVEDKRSYRSSGLADVRSNASISLQPAARGSLKRRAFQSSLAARSRSVAQRITSSEQMSSKSTATGSASSFGRSSAEVSMSCTSTQCPIDADTPQVKSSNERVAPDAHGLHGVMHSRAAALDSTTEAAPTALPALYTAEEVVQLTKDAIGPDARIDDQIVHMIAHMAQSFLDDIVEAAAGVMRHRGSQVLEAKDIALVMEMDWGSTITDSLPR